MLHVWSAMGPVLTQLPSITFTTNLMKHPPAW